MNGMNRSLALAITLCFLGAPASAMNIKLGGLDNEGEFNSTSGIYTFNESFVGNADDVANPAGEGGVVTTSDLAGLINGIVDFEIILTSDPNGSIVSQSFGGTGGNEFRIWDATITTVLLEFDLSYIDVTNATTASGSSITLGESVAANGSSALTVSGGSLANAVGGIGRNAALSVFINKPRPKLAAGGLASGYLNNDFTTGLVVTAATNWDMTIFVPEPSTATLLGLGLAGLAARHRRRALSS